MVEGEAVELEGTMANPGMLKDLRARELGILRERVARRVKIKPLAKRTRKIVGLDLALTPRASKMHVCACLMSLPNLVTLEEAIATDELDVRAFKELGLVALVPLTLSVLKMLKRNFDVIIVREPVLSEAIPLSSYVGVISGKPAYGISERASTLSKLATWEGRRRAGAVKIRGRGAAVSVIAGHNIDLKDAASVTKACARETRLPEPVRNAGTRVRAWEREWKRVNLGKR
jgi:deoxyinosine 3'endonuclease (endonuclease V)